jgi:hypothetical protein
VSIPQGESGAPLHLPFLATSPFWETTLPRKQVGESASPRLDAGDMMADGSKRIKMIGAEQDQRLGPYLSAVARWCGFRGLRAADASGDLIEFRFQQPLFQ